MKIIVATLTLLFVINGTPLININHLFDVQAQCIDDTQKDIAYNLTDYFTENEFDIINDIIYIKIKSPSDADIDMANKIVNGYDGIFKKMLSYNIRGIEISFKANDNTYLFVSEIKNDTIENTVIIY